MKRTLRIAILAVVAAVLLPLSGRAQWNTQPGYRSFYDLGVNIGTGAPSKTCFEIGTSQGYQIVPTYLYIGTGAAFQAFFNADGACGFPVFFNLRTNFSPASVSPFLDVRVGYASITNSDYYDNGGFYLCPTLGLRFAINSNVAINLRAGYTWQYARCWTDAYDSWTESWGRARKNKNIGGATVTVGVEF